ncbi:dTDP-4-dehydrorhamnose 3,5-epimerase [Nostoc sp. NIES-4103]|nr:dTDP-4-dehydrorhamnose 3,5-epimerase [Nostoc sp. NIES-4103]
MNGLLCGTINPNLAIAWPIQEQAIVSAKDQAGKLLQQAQVYR